MAINGEHSIFRLTSSSPLHTESTVSDKIEFDGDAVIPDGKSHITHIRPMYKAVKTENPNPGSQNSSSGQDTGNQPFRIEVKGYIDKRSGSALGISSIFRTWIKAPKVVKTLYPKGRFGFRSTQFPEFNAVPGVTGGYRLTEIEFPYVAGTTGHVPFILYLDFYGDMALLGA